MSNINEMVNLLSGVTNAHPFLFRFLSCACVATFLIAVLTDTLKQNPNKKSRPVSEPKESSTSSAS